MKTAVTVECTPYAVVPEDKKTPCGGGYTWFISDAVYERTEPVKVPNGFIADECFAPPERNYNISINDAEGALLIVNASAFQFGPLAFWRKPYGFIHVTVKLIEPTAVIPPYYVTFRGLIR